MSTITSEYHVDILLTIPSLIGNDIEEYVDALSANHKHLEITLDDSIDIKGTISDRELYSLGKRVGYLTNHGSVFLVESITEVGTAAKVEV